MSYGRVLLPRFYTDTINWLHSRGELKSTTLSSAGHINTGYTVYDAFNMRPLSVLSFDTSANTAEHQRIKIDMRIASANQVGFVAIINHNCLTAQAKIRIGNDTSALTAVGSGTTPTPTVMLSGTAGADSGAVIDMAPAGITDVATTLTVDDGTLFTVGEFILIEAEVILISAISTNDLTVVRAQQGTSGAVHADSEPIYYYNTVTPTTDGDILFTFPTVSSRQYWSVEFIPSHGAFAADLTVGEIIIGMYHTMSRHPALEVEQIIKYDGNEISETPGGRRFSHSNWITSNDGTSNYQPFGSQTGLRRQAGRRGYKLNFPMMPDSDFIPSDYGGSLGTGTGLKLAVLDKTAGSHIPVIFTPDSTSTTKGDYMYARIIPKEYPLAQQAWQMINFSLEIEQEF